MADLGEGPERPALPPPPLILGKKKMTEVKMAGRVSKIKDLSSYNPVAIVSLQLTSLILQNRDRFVLDNLTPALSCVEKKKE